MKVSVQFPLHTKSENTNRRFGNPMARHHSTARERRDVRMFLDSQLPRLRARLAEGPNFFRVTIVRIGAGLLDSDNIHGALKAVRDEVAAWLGIDDGPTSPASWKVGQQKCPPGFWAVRVEIEDDDPDQREVHRVCGPTIPRLGPVIGDCSHCGRPTRPIPPEEMLAAVKAVKRIFRQAERAEQARLVFRRAFYALPEEQGEDAVLHEIGGVGDPPKKTLWIKRGGETIELTRRLCKDFPELGECWLYEVAESSPAAITMHEQKEAMGCRT